MVSMYVFHIFIAFSALLCGIVCLPHLLHRIECANFWFINAETIIGRAWHKQNFILFPRHNLGISISFQELKT